LTAIVGLALVPVATAKDKKPSIEREASESVTATVEEIDSSARLLTLKGPKGELVTLAVPEEVERFPQIKVGDKVRAEYYESLAVDVHKAGTVPLGSSAEAAVIPVEGTKPAGVAGAQVTANVTVEAIDLQNKSLTVRTVDGDSLSFRVKKPKHLKSLAVGDIVSVTYTRAVAIEVMPTS
jgi:hypothetical protein